MDIDIKIFFSVIAVLIIILGELVYIREIFKGTAKPHPFTWLGWSVITGVVAAAQVWDGAGFAFYVLAVESFMTFFIFLLALKYGEKKIFLTDWLAFLVGVGSIFLWYFSQTPLYSVLLLTVADVLMFIPTIRKTFLKPFDEELFEYYTSSLAYGVSFFALENLSLITFFYPGVLILLNGIFIIFTLVSRKVFKDRRDIVVSDASVDELYLISLKSAQVKEKKVYIYEKYNLDILLGERSGEVREEIIRRDVRVYQLTNNENLSKKGLKLSKEFSKNITIKFIPKEVFDIQNEMIIFDNTVSVYNIDEEKKITSINNDLFAKNQKQLFRFLWERI